MVRRVQRLEARDTLSDQVAEAQLQRLQRESQSVPLTGEVFEGLRQHALTTAPFQVHGTEIRIFAEAFYYCAFRLTKVCQDQLGLKVAAVGIRDVRNHLLQHPEGKSSGVIEQGSSWSPDSGVVLKGVRRVENQNTFPDKGFHANARELAESLESTLTRALLAV
jgi:hypothetical protein